MTRLILAAVAVVALSELTPARAQFVVGPARPFGYGYGGGYFYRSGFGFSVGGPHFRATGFYGGFVTRSVYYAPPPGFGYNPFVPVGYGFGNPFLGGWGPGFGPPVVVVPVAVPVIVGGGFPDPNEAGAPVVPPRNDGLPRGLLKDGDYLVISPKKEVSPPPVNRFPPRPPGPVIVFDPFKPVEVKVEVAEADPKKEAARLIKLGRASFATGDYGRAAEHFERASTADPTNALACFLHGQAKFAAGQYADAETRIREGLARDPRWPAAAFNPTEPYGDSPERFVLHLTALKKTVADNPNQAALEFVLGYELWFSGEKVEADKLFRAAEKRLPAPGPIALFKLP